jgi:CHAT domain-containing protein
VVGALLSCSRGRAPDSELADANREFSQGDLERSQQDAQRGYQRFRTQPEWAWKFRVLEARAALWRGMHPDVLRILDTPGPSDQPDILISQLSLRGVATAYIHNFPEAERLLNQATELCAQQAAAGCGELLQSRGLLASQQGKSSSAENFYQQALAFARSHQDSFLESSALLNLAAESLPQGHFDEAIDYSETSLRIAKIEHARVLELANQANIGWAKYRLGDADGALSLFLDAEKLAAELGDVSDQENELTNLGYIYMDEGKLDQANQSFREALDLAKNNNLKEHVYNALRVLARLSLRRGDLEKASEFADQALDLARETSNRTDELYPRLVQGQIADKRGNHAKAEATFLQIEQDQTCPVFLKWDAQHSLAQLYETQNQTGKANQEYRAALATFEVARATVRHEDFRPSFLTNAAHIYDDYVHFLVANGKTDEALRWADFSRARTLSEGLGLLSQDRSGRTDNRSPVAPGLNPQAIARLVKGTLFFYWLGEKQSYLWATDSNTTRLFTLPPRSDIEAAVQRHRSALNGPQDILESGGGDGRTLYQMLVAPAQSMLRPNEKVYVFPDGSLNNLNFETLIVPSPKPHFWIEDADVINASSLRILAASRAPTKNHANSLLLIGDSVAVGKDYPELPKAADQMASVAKHFSPDKRRIFSREQANPAAYLQNAPEQFSNIHFVAHGTASRLSPLDSAIVLSGDADNPSSFKLYARDIVHHRLKADLVTISACYGAGERQYSGEGLVGLAWAFLYAGSHNVIAALWDVSDASTYQLMDRFYEELSKGASPDAALRAAKLSLLQGTAFRNPFYWAPFQLYAA